MAHSFVLTGGGTGGHVFPALAVGRVLRERGHKLLFVGTREGIEARLVPAAGFEIAFVRSGGLNRVGARQRIRTAVLLPSGVAEAWRILRRARAQAVFSMGGYVSGPVMLAASVGRIPIVAMEPNSVPGFANRLMAKRLYRALVAFPTAAASFPASSTELTGLPVRAEFFQLAPKQSGPFTILITGGSRGSRTLNRSSRESWPLFRSSASPVRILHQSGTAEHAELASEFASSGLAGELVPFLSDMAQAFASADLVVSRSGAGGVSEIAAAGMASLLVPFPFAADDHQRKNAEALVAAGAARMVLDADMSGQRLFQEVEDLRQHPAMLEAMRSKVRAFAHPGAAERTADILEEAARNSNA